MTPPTPVPIFDTLENLASRQLPADLSAKPWAQKDYTAALDFLKQYNGSQSTFNAYRREIERLLQWSWRIADKSILELTREDIETYLEFCIKPPETWIGTKRVSRFLNKDGQRVPNPAWRLFVASVSKADFKRGKRADPTHYRASEKSIREVFVIAGSFYTNLINSGTLGINPVLLIRQKSKYFTRKQGTQRVERLLTERQWRYCIDVAESMAEHNPVKHERSLFILSALYLMYLRVSELTATARWQPVMGHFSRNAEGAWFFKVLGKGNKLRTVSVSDGMLNALRRYRKHLDLTPLPSPADNTPLIPKLKGQGPISSAWEIRHIIQSCFDQAVICLRESGHADDANALESATVHWLRHTGISDDLNKRGRPMVHVRDDAGHEKSSTTDRYNNADIQERYLSAKEKTTHVSDEEIKGDFA